MAELFSMRGPWGCCKTTTLRMIAEFEAPGSGQLLLDGVDIRHTQASGLRRQHVGKDEIRSRVGAALELARLEAPAKRKPLQQTVEITQAELPDDAPRVLQGSAAETSDSEEALSNQLEGVADA